MSDQLRLLLVNTHHFHFTCCSIVATRMCGTKPTRSSAALSILRGPRMSDRPGLLSATYPACAAPAATLSRMKVCGTKPTGSSSPLGPSRPTRERSTLLTSANDPACAAPAATLSRIKLGGTKPARFSSPPGPSRSRMERSTPAIARQHTPLPLHLLQYRRNENVRNEAKAIFRGPHPIDARAWRQPLLPWRRTRLAPHRLRHCPASKWAERSQRNSSVPTWPSRPRMSDQLRLLLVNTHHFHFTCCSIVVTRMCGTKPRRSCGPPKSIQPRMGDNVCYPWPPYPACAASAAIPSRTRMCGTKPTRSSVALNPSRPTQERSTLLPFDNVPGFRPTGCNTFRIKLGGTKPTRFSSPPGPSRPRMSDQLRLLLVNTPASCDTVANQNARNEANALFRCARPFGPRMSDRPWLLSATYPACAPPAATLSQLVGTKPARFSSPPGPSRPRMSDQFRLLFVNTPAPRDTVANQHVRNKANAIFRSAQPMEAGA